MSLQASFTDQALAASLLSVCLTYLAHAATFAAAAALVARLPRLSFAARNACWKAALFGPLLSTALAGSAVAGSAVHGISAGDSAVSPPLSSTPSPTTWLPQLELAWPSAWPNGTSLVWVALAAAGLGLLRFAMSAAALSRHLHHRTRVTEGRVVHRFETLRARTGLSALRLTESALLSSPLVLGRREVCLPLGMSSILTDEDLDAVLAHELAHLERRDGIWFPLVGALQCTLWFQPLNHVVASRFRSSAELSCDDRAVELTRDPQALARALVRLAEAATVLPSSVLAPAILRKRSDLLGRVQRLAALSPLDRVAAPRGRRRALASVAVVGIALLTLSVRVVHARLPVSPAAASSSTVVATISPSPAERGASMNELAARDRQLTAVLAELSTSAQAARDGTPEHTRMLELEQELRHARAMQVWLEQRFIAAEQRNDRR